MARLLAPFALLAGLSTLPLAGCAWFAAHPQVRGNRIDPDALAELLPGISTKADATALLGSPTMHASFDDNVWLYIGSITRPVLGGTQKVVSQRTAALSFDSAGILRQVKMTDQKDALPAVMIARVTPSPGSNASFMELLLGNVGKFNSLSQGPQTNAGTSAAGADMNADSSRFSTGY